MGQLAPPIAWIQNYWHCTSSVAPCCYHRADNFFTPLHLGSLITSGPAASRLDSTSSRLWLCFIYSLSGSIFPDLSLVSVFQSSESKSCGRRFYRYIPFHYLGLATIGSDVVGVRAASRIFTSHRFTDDLAQFFIAQVLIHPN